MESPGTRGQRGGTGREGTSISEVTEGKMPRRRKWVPTRLFLGGFRRGPGSVEETGETCVGYRSVKWKTFGRRNPRTHRGGVQTGDREGKVRGTPRGFTTVPDPETDLREGVIVGGDYEAVGGPGSLEVTCEVWFSPGRDEPR